MVCWLSFLNTSHDSRFTLADCQWGLSCLEYQSSPLCWVPCPDALPISPFIWNCYLWGINFFFPFNLWFFLSPPSLLNLDLLTCLLLLKCLGSWLCRCVLTWEVPASLLALFCSSHLNRKHICYQSLQARGHESTGETRCLLCFRAPSTRRIICTLSSWSWGGGWHWVLFLWLGMFLSCLVWSCLPGIPEAVDILSLVDPFVVQVWLHPLSPFSRTSMVSIFCYFCWEWGPAFRELVSVLWDPSL